jgi:SAM-dependent methyltransferase
VRGWLVPVGVVESLKRRPRLYRPARRVRMRLGSVVPPYEIDGIRGRVHRNDTMLRDASPVAIERYAEGTQNVLRLLGEALDRAGRGFDDVRSWLDFGCGYGRVIRDLVERVPRERIWAADVNAEGARFCEQEFGVHAVVVPSDPSRLGLPAFDVVYAISVFTHLPPGRDRQLLEALGAALADDGVVLFTTQGQRSLETIERYGDVYPPLRPTLQRDVAAKGIAYVPYAHYAGDDYGMTWHSREYVEGLVRDLHGESLELLFFEAHGLDGHQDVYAYRRVRA